MLQIMRIADRDGGGTISRAEFRKSYAAIKQLMRDEDGDGIPDGMEEDNDPDSAEV